MKARITSVDFLKEKEGNYGTLYSFKVGYDGKYAYYNSKKRDQAKFVAGKEAEFSEQELEGKNGNKFYIIKPVKLLNLLFIHG